MTRFLAAACAAALLIGCSGKSESNDAGKGPSTGTAGAAGGTAGKGQGGSATAGAGALAGHAGAGENGGASGGSSGARGGTGGTGGASAGSGGSANGGASGRAGGSGGAGGSGAGRGGSDAGAAGAAGESGMRCGGMDAIGCPSFEYCDFGGLCTLGDAEGVCRSTSTETCSAERVCGCDGKVYANDCRAHSAGVDVTDSSHCVAGGGDQGDACVVDDDCTGDLKCCSSPIGVVSCTTPAGNGCPMTP